MPAIDTSGQTFLVTGATRGIGAQLVEQLVSNPANKVVAGVRQLKAPLSQKLVNAKHPNLTVVQINSESDTDATKAAQELKTAGITSIDVIIANAGISAGFLPATQVGIDDFRKAFSVNVGAPLLLFQAFLPFLQKSNNPRFIVVSTLIASKTLQRHIPYQSTTYGTSKAAVNFLTLRLAIENPEITSFVLHPGLVDTEMASEAQIFLGSTIEDALAQGSAISPQASAQAIIELATEATLEYSGKFYDAPKKEEVSW
jgi:norsolorinic acid ketoreductase